MLPAPIYAQHLVPLQLVCRVPPARVQPAPTAPLVLTPPAAIRYGRV